MNRTSFILTQLLGASLLLTACASDGSTSRSSSSSYSDRISSGTGGTRAGAAEASLRTNRTKGATANMALNAHAFPTGDPDTSAVLLEKFTPKEAALGQPFAYQIHVTNLTQHALDNLRVTDKLNGDFNVLSSEPRAAGTNQKSVSWNLGNLAAGQTSVIVVNASTRTAGVLSSCASVDYDSAVCASIPVVQPLLKVELATVTEVIACDEIPLEYTVTNAGSGIARDVVLESKLPAGLKTKDGKSSVTLRVPQLAAGESKQVLVQATADHSGTFVTEANAVMSSGVKAQPVSRTIVVRQPKLTLVANAPKTAFLDRKGTWTYTVTNTGDIASKDSKLELTLPAGLEYVGSTPKGKKSGNKFTLDLGTLDVGAKRDVSVQFRGENQGTARVQGRASGYCSDTVSSVTETAFKGIPAILLEVVDLEDPVIVGETLVYEIRVTNQGSAPGTNIRIACELDKGMKFMSGEGPTSVSATGAQVLCETLSSLAPKKSVTWRLTVSGASAGDLRFRTAMTSDQLSSPVDETESTTFYD